MRAPSLAFVLGALAVAAAARDAAATPYETFIDVNDQADLDDLLASGDISQDTYNELLDLLDVGIDLSTADRDRLYALPNLTYEDVDAIIAFRELQQGRIADPAALVPAGVLSEEKLLAISAFLVMRPRGAGLAVRGWVRAMTRYTWEDDRLPPVALRGRFTIGRNVVAGFASVMTRLRIGEPVYDPNRDALIADPAGYRFNLPKVFVKYEDERAAAIAGSYRIGFAQRLTFDNSAAYTPNGIYTDDQLFFSANLATACREAAGELASSPCAGVAGRRYVTPDWRWRDGLMGAAAGLKRIELGAGWAQGYLWASSSRRSIYQYELVDRDKCPDPRNNSDPNCSAPTVFVRPEGDILTPTTRHTFATLPNVFAERLAGANLTYFADRRNSVGLTAYAAHESNLVEGIDLDTQEWSRIPMGKTFGAGGAAFSLGKGWLDVFGEATYSFDRGPAPVSGRGGQQGGGGPAAILRVTATKAKQELEGVLRYYSIDFANPYARPISQPDQFEGQRARDEVGARLRYVNTNRQLTLRAAIDVWAPVSSFHDDSILGRVQPKLDTWARADVQTTRELRLGLWLRYQDKDLGAGGHDQCYEVTTETNEDGAPIPCSGRQLTSVARARYQLRRNLVFTGMIQHQLLDDQRLDPTAFRQDLSGWGIVQWRPTPKIRMRARVRYLDEDFCVGCEDAYLERSLSTLVDTVFTLNGRDQLRVRGDTKFWLDNRASTLDRAPNPELQLWLSYEARL